MKAIDLVKDLSAAGARLRLDGGDIRIRAPHGVLTEARREMIRAQKPELVALLSTYPCVKCGRFAFSCPNTTCYWCGPKPPGMAA